MKWRRISIAGCDNILHKRLSYRRRGAIVVLTAVLMVFLLAMLAFSIDVGYRLVVQTELDRAVDAGALAGAGTLVDGQDQAIAAARHYVRTNRVGQVSVDGSDMNIETGAWDPVTRTFTPTTNLPSAIKVRAASRRQPYVFARVLGDADFDVVAEAVAICPPRDIVVVLDYSASMNDDSELRSIGILGQAAVEANLLRIYEELESPRFGKMQWKPVYIPATLNATIKSQLGLDGVPYPFPSGSWDQYINYVRSDSHVYRAGYRKSYGYLTLVNYWLDLKPMKSQTPDLWRTTEQPITALKEALTVFLSYLKESNVDDRVALSVYTAADGGATLETGLTDDFSLIESISRQRQAGHYHNHTNIGAGLELARRELDNNARHGAYKMIVLMTDGFANLPGNMTVGRQLALAEAQLCSNRRYPVVTISLGAAADTALMGSIAQATQGAHFNIPGGQPVSSYEKELKDVFRRIAKDHPVQLVK